MFQEKSCPTILRHHHLDQLHRRHLRVPFQLKILPPIMIHSFLHSIKIRLPVIFPQLVSHIHFIRMQLHHIFQVKQETIRTIFLNKQNNQ